MLQSDYIAMAHTADWVHFLLVNHQDARGTRGKKDPWVVRKPEAIDMTRQAFDDFIKKTNVSAQNSKVDWDKQREEWLSCLKQFYGMVDDFISDYVEAHQLSRTWRKKALNEENIGSYDVDVLSININTITITLTPIGTLLIGGKGRVDMVGPKGKVKFVLVPKGSTRPNIVVKMVAPGDPSDADAEEQIKEWEWRIMTSPPQISYLPLHGDAFYSAMLEVING